MYNSNSRRIDTITNELYLLQTLPYRLKVIGLCCKMFLDKEEPQHAAFGLCRWNFVSENNALTTRRVHLPS